MKILVIGDGCQDRFQYGKCERLSPEAPVPVFTPTELKINGGMALNVAENIRALDMECDVIFNAAEIPTKTRLVDEVSNQILLRVDKDDKVKQIEFDLLDNIDFSEYAAVVIVDYNKGYLGEEDINWITELHPLVFMDTKKKINKWASGVEFIKINEKEYANNVEYLLKHDGDLIVTLGKGGAVFKMTHQKEKFFPIEKEHPVRDLSGAGDTFLAALVVSYVKNNNIEEAIRFANKCASWVVTQKGVVAVDPTRI